jgi:hypothetical protein
MGSPVPTSARGLNRLPPFHGWAHPPFEFSPVLNALVPVHIFPRSGCAHPRSSLPTSAPGLIGSPPRISRAGRRIAAAHGTRIGSATHQASTGAEVRHVHPEERYATHAHAHAQLCKHACTHTRARTHTHNHAHVRTHSIAIATGRIFCCACIRHGEHTVVAGRISPYFFNFGNFRTGRDLYLLGR